MVSIGEFMTGDHRRCDALFVEVERAGADARWDRCAAALGAFASAFEAHLRREEEVLFPELEARTGDAAGPAGVMRAEHARMRELVTAMGDAVERRDVELLLGLAETFHVMNQQHNIKEEQILYPAAERAFGPGGAGVLARLREVDAP